MTLIFEIYPERAQERLSFHVIVTKDVRNEICPKDKIMTLA